MNLRFKILKASFIFSILAFTLVQCNSSKTDENTKDTTTDLTVTPVPLPTNIVPGFNFPEDSSVINQWITDTAFANQYDSASIYKHAWGIWAGLTAPSGQRFAGDSLLVYETWLGLSEVQKAIIDSNIQGGCQGVKRDYRAMLTRPKQFEHAARFGARKKGLTTFKQIPSEAFDNFWVTVSYSPDAACYSTRNQLFKTSTINNYFNEGKLGSIPPFPNTSITIKPAYLIYDDSARLFKVPVWLTTPNPPDSSFFGSTDTFVYVDKNNKQENGKKLVPVSGAETNPEKIAQATCNLRDFIYFRVDQSMATFMNQQDSVQGLNGAGKAQRGNIALLVGMHVTTKEISNWTWQSYYWSPNPSQPGSPSSDLASRLRPAEIKGAPAHYAAVAAYVMLTPNNAPSTSKKAGAMFGYNPYLEGSFGPTTFGIVNSYNKNFVYGVQTNCMSCHALALPDPSAGQYTTDQTINLKGMYFKNQVSLDFAWSIQTALINDTIPYWEFSKKKQK